MPNTNITKFSAFVIFAMLSMAASGCTILSPQGAGNDDGPYKKHVISGKLESPDLREASGIAASKCQPDVYWTHNDSGGKALLYAIDSKGSHLGVWKVVGASNRDWEDIAAVKVGDKCYVLIGDIGDNDRKHERLAIYRVEEPVAGAEAKTSSATEPLSTADATAAFVKYPNELHDAEALLAHPTNGEVYVVTKLNNSPSHVYKIRPRYEGEEQTLTKIADLAVPAVPNGSITGGDISPDGKRVALCDYFSGYELTLPDGARNFDEIWKQQPLRIELGKRVQGEAIAYSADGEFVIAVSEKRHTTVNIAHRRKAN